MELLIVIILILSVISYFYDKNSRKNRYDADLANIYETEFIKQMQGGKLTSEGKTKLEAICKTYNINPGKLATLHKKIFKSFANELTKTGKLDDRGLEIIENFLAYTDIKSLGLDLATKKQILRCRSLWLIEDKKTLPYIGNDMLPINFKSGETLVWFYPAAYMKMKKVTQRISYSGLTASIRIAKGIRYRVGSITPSISKKEILDTEDTGSFWMTNKRIGFLGDRKHFSLEYNKIFSFEITGQGLVIRKEGRETPFIIHMDNYKISCAITSLILNEPEQVTIETPSIPAIN